MIIEDCLQLKMQTWEVLLLICWIRTILQYLKKVSKLLGGRDFKSDMQINATLRQEVLSQIQVFLKKTIKASLIH